MVLSKSILIRSNPKCLSLWVSSLLAKGFVRACLVIALEVLPIAKEGGAGTALKLKDELNKSWTKTWTASLNPLASGLNGNPRHLLKSVGDCVLGFDKWFDRLTITS